MSVPLPNRVIAAFRALLVADADLRAYVGEDYPGGPDPEVDPPTAARVMQKWSIGTEQAQYPAITLWVPRTRLDVVFPRTWNPGFVEVCYHSLKEDQRTCLAMYEIVSRLLHTQKGALSVPGSVCVHEVVERDARDPVFLEASSTWVGYSLYRVRASIID